MTGSAAHGYVDEMRALIDWVGKDIDPVNAAKVQGRAAGDKNWGLRRLSLFGRGIRSIYKGQKT